MAKIPEITLEDYLRQYLDNQAIKNEKQTFSEYSEKYHSDYKGRYNDAITKILEKERRAASDVGVAGEKLGGAGLENSGYARYIKSGLTPDLTGERAKAEDAYNDSRTKAETQYNRYSIAYDIDQEETAEKVKDELFKNGVTDPANVYTYAIEAGLTKENATALAVSITAATRDELKTKLIDGLFKRTLSAESASALAKLYGFEGKELEELEGMFEWYKVNHTEIPADFLDYLTKLSSYFNPASRTED